MTANENRDSKNGKFNKNGRLNELYALISHINHRRDVADKFSDYWHGIYISLIETINNVFDERKFPNEGECKYEECGEYGEEEHEHEYEEELELMIRISRSLQKLKEICDERTYHWDKVLDETNDELTRLERLEGLERLEARIHEGKVA